MKTSTTFKEMIPDLIKAQALIKPILKKGENPHFHSDYAEYKDVVEEVKRVLNENSMWLSHPCHIVESGALVMETVVVHTSGEWISNELPVINKAGTDQGLGSSLTYTKRYSLEALMGISTTGDDDGNAATEPKVPPQNTGPKAIISEGAKEAARSMRIGLSSPHKDEYKDNQHSQAFVTDAQVKRLFAIAKKHNWSNDKIKDFIKVRYQIDTTKDLTRFNYDHLISAIEQTK